jgi:spore coat protein D
MDNLHCPKKPMGPVMHPTQKCVKDICHPHVVHHIHPSETIYKHHHIYQHKHHYPHKECHVCEVSHQHYQCGMPKCQCQMPMQQQQMGPMMPKRPFGSW